MALSRDGIVELALRHIDEVGVDDFSMRKVAAELGVTSMALYRHVKDREELLDAVVERVVQQVDLRPPDTGEWVDRMCASLQAARTQYRAHPNVIALMATRDLRTTGTARFVDGLLVVLLDAGFDGPGAVRALRHVLAYLFGSLMGEVGRRTLDEHDPGRRAAGAALHESAPLQHRPAIDDAVAAFALGSTRKDEDELFDHGLRALLRGLEDELLGR